MTEHELKELKNLGAELGAAKAEVERLRGLLERVATIAEEREHGYATRQHGGVVNGRCADKIVAMLDEIHATLSQQADPAETTEAYTAVDMATAAAQGFRDGQAAVEQDTAPDEREAPVVVATAILGGIYHGGSGPELGEIDIEVCMPALEALQCETVNSSDDVFLPLMSVAQHERIVAALTRPAQTEQQPEQSRPTNKLRALAEIWDQNADEADEFGNAQAAEALRLAAFELRATLSAPLGKFRMGDLVKKSTGSEWVGRVCGWYSTNQTPEGYAVESEAHAGSVQIYPAKALEAVE